FLQGHRRAQRVGGELASARRIALLDPHLHRKAAMPPAQQLAAQIPGNGAFPDEEPEHRATKTLPGGRREAPRRAHRRAIERRCCIVMRTAVNFASAEIARRKLSITANKQKTPALFRARGFGVWPGGNLLSRAQCTLSSAQTRFT